MIRRTQIKRKRGKKKLSWSRRRTKEKNAMIRELDASCRQRVMERDQEMCARAGVSPCEGPLQWSHVITREVLALRWEDENSQAMCRGHHHWWHMNHSQAILWFSTHWPERWEHIKRIYQSNVKFGFEEVKALLADLRGATK
jgi:hypothetical protein